MTKILKYIILYLTIFLSIEMYGQSVGITDGPDFTPDGSSILELKSTVRGFLMPRMTKAQREAITSPAAGLMVIQTDEVIGSAAGIWYYYVDPNNPLNNEWRNVYSEAYVSNIGLTLDYGTFNISIASNTATITGAWNSQNANLVFASPNGASGTPTFRKIVAGDISSIDASTISSGTLSVLYGGTGLNTAPTANSVVIGNTTGDGYTNTGAGTSGQVLVVNSSGVPVWQNTPLPTLSDAYIWIGSDADAATPRLISGDGTISNLGVLTVTGINGVTINNTAPTNNQVLSFNNTSGEWEATTIDAANLTGTLPVANGGTGANSLTGMVKGNGTSAMTGITNTAGNITIWADANTIGGDNDFAWDATNNILTVNGSVTLTPTTTAPSTPTVGQFYFNTTTNDYVYWNGSAWVTIGSTGGGLPTLNNGQLWIGSDTDVATAQTITGDGTISNAGLLTVTKIQGTSISNTAPTNNQVLTFNSTSGEWEATTIDAANLTGTLPVANGGTGATSLTGMVKGNGTSAMTGITNTAGNITIWADANTIGGDDKFKWNSADSILTIRGSISLTPTDEPPINPTIGQYYFDETQNDYQYWNGLAWVTIGSTSGGGLPTGGTTGQYLTIDVSNNPIWSNPTFWGLTGNSGTNSTTNYIGTSDNVDLSIRTTATERISISATSGVTTVKDGLNVYDGISTLNATDFKSTFVSDATQSADINYVFPPAQGGANTYLKNNGSGNLSWEASTVGSVPFSSITTGTNTAADMTVSTGASILLDGTGIVQSNAFIGTGSTDGTVELATAEVSGTLPVSKGGTGSTTQTPFGVAYGNTTGDQLVYTAAGTTGQVLVGNTGGSPNWASATALSWGVTGNSGTNSSTNFVGTTDGQDLAFRTNNIERMRLSTDGNLSILNSNNNAAELRFQEPSGFGQNITAFKAQSQNNDHVYTLPPNNTLASYNGSDNMGVLAGDMSGNNSNLQWISAKSFGGSYVNVIVTEVNQDYTATSTDAFIIISTNNKTVTLPSAAANAGKVYYVVIATAVTAQAYLGTTGSDKISVETLLSTMTLKYGNGNADFSGAVMVSDGVSKWYVISTRRSNQ